MPAVGSPAQDEGMSEEPTPTPTPTTRPGAPCPPPSSATPTASSSSPPRGWASRRGRPPAPDDGEAPTNPADLVEQPAKVMRIGSMVKQLLEEVRSAPLDDRGRARLADIHDRSIAELKDGLAPELVAELERIALPFKDAEPRPTPSSASPRPSWSAGSRGSSTASRPPSSPSRWPRRPSCSRCAHSRPG